MVHYGSTIRCWYVLIHTNIYQLISNIQRSQKWMRHDFILEARLSCSGRRATWWPRCFKRWDLTEILDDFGIILSLSSTRPDRFAGRPVPRSQRSILKAIENQESHLGSSWLCIDGLMDLVFYKTVCGQIRQLGFSQFLTGQVVHKMRRVHSSRDVLVCWCLSNWRNQRK